MLIHNWLIVALAVVVAVVGLSLIKDGENDSLMRRNAKRIGLMVVVDAINALRLYLLPTAVLVENNKESNELKVIGSPSVNTEWGWTIALQDLDNSAEYVVNKSLDTLILFPLIYSKAGFKAYDSYNLTRDVVDIPPGEYRKADYHVTTFFVIPDEEMLKLTEARGKDYALMTRLQLSSLLNMIILRDMVAEEYQIEEEMPPEEE